MHISVALIALTIATHFSNERRSVLFSADEIRDERNVESVVSPHRSRTEAKKEIGKEKTLATSHSSEVKLEMSSTMKRELDSQVEMLFYCSGAPMRGDEALRHDVKVYEGGWPAEYYSSAYEKSCAEMDTYSSDALRAKLVKLGEGGSSLAWMRLSFLYENGAVERVAYLQKALSLGEGEAARYLMEAFLYRQNKQDANSVEMLVAWINANFMGTERASLIALHQEYQTALMQRCQNDPEECQK